MPPLISRWLNVAKGMLPALGFGMLFSMMYKPKYVPYFIIGFILSAVFKGSLLAIGALASFSGITSQPNLNSMAALLEGNDRENPLNKQSLNEHSNYWEAVREFYYPFESDLKSATAEVYDNEIPGGQYSNLRQQAEGVGLGDKYQVI